MNSKIKIACLHEEGKAGITTVVDDYHPLCKMEIAQLLIMAAKNHGNVQIISEVQVRLQQGIKGMTCPRPIGGEVAEKLNEMNDLFIKKYIEGGSPDTIERLYQIVTRTPRKYRIR